MRPELPLTLERTAAPPYSPPPYSLLPSPVPPPFPSLKGALLTPRCRRRLQKITARFALFVARPCVCVRTRPTHSPLPTNVR